MKADQAGRGKGSALARNLIFRYVGDPGEDEMINQTLEVVNEQSVSVVPVLRFRALGKDREPLPRVKVTTVYGSDKGRLVLPSGSGYDILRFSGPGAQDVADVEVTVERVEIAEKEAGATPVTTQALDAEGGEVSRFGRFAKVRLTNDNSAPVWVRVAYVVWDQPADGDTQQAVEVTPVGGLTMIPPRLSFVVDVDPRAAAAIARNANGPAVSIKAYNSQ
ncbi:hypothetical protein [Streptomyces zhihengii]|uniref:hypothetical protein n=1 Tax=Streptomyces zhihengii TaxID=1818004 RepID=UPI00339DD415